LKAVFQDGVVLTLLVVLFGLLAVVLLDVVVGVEFPNMFKQSVVVVELRGEEAHGVVAV
jgi:hypothetical protein